jgi:hypothetical protein
MNKMKIIQTGYKFLLFISLTGFVSCTDSTTEDTTTVGSTEDSLFTSIPETKFTGIYDTLGCTFLVNTISKEQYESISPLVPIDDSIRTALCGDKEGGCMETMEKYYLSKVSGKAKRTGNDLMLILSNGQTKVLKNNTKEDDDYEVYQFLTLDANGYYIVAVFYFESYAYLLINPVNGSATRTIGYPVVSPDKKQYVAGNYDMVAAFTFNGIDFLSITKDSVFSNVMIDFMTWGPEELKWKDDSTLYIKQKSQIGEELKEENNFAALRIRKKSGI